MKYGYARVSTKDQNITLQIDDLLAQGCDKIIDEVIGGTRPERPKLKALIDSLNEGDVLVVWKLDRLGRNLKDLITIITDLMDRKVGFVSLNDPIDTTTSHGRLIFNIFGSLAEFERDLIRERTFAGLKSARARGRLGGRPKGLSDAAKEKACAAETLYKEGKLSTSEICRQLNICRYTLYAYLRHRNVKVSSYKIQSTSGNTKVKTAVKNQRKKPEKA